MYALTCGLVDLRVQASGGYCIAERKQTLSRLLTRKTQILLQEESL